MKVVGSLQQESDSADAFAAGGGGGDPYIRRPMLYALGGSSSLTTVGRVGNSTTWNQSGTVSSDLGTATVFMTRYTSAATANAVASADMSLGQYIPPTASRNSPAIAISAVLDFTDAYATGGARVAFGAGRDPSSAIGSDNGIAADNTSQGVWFSYSTTRGGNWRVVVYKDSVTTPTVIDTGVAFSTGIWALGLEFAENSASFKWSIRKVGSTAATTGTATNSGSPLPTNVLTTYVMFAAICTLSAAAKYFGIRRIGVDLLEPV